MPKKKQSKPLCVDELRHMEYYGMQQIFDDLYAKSKAGEIFTDLLSLILSRENILLAYRNIKTNAGSNTPGTDGITIVDIGKLSSEAVVEKIRFIVTGSQHGYRPKPVRRKEIPKPYDPSATRPLGIPCMWDRLVQQCIKQVMEPICEAKFSNNSYGFRPGRSAEHAIQRCYCLMQLTKLHYVVEFDIKGFFDNVNHSKLLKQIWTLGIRDKHLIWILKQVLKAPVKMPDGKIVIPEKGTPQGGIISPLLANVVLNELDHWVESQWQKHPVIQKYSAKENSTGSLNYGNGYKAMKKTNLKEMYIVRYADDFRVFCRTKNDADKTKIAITKWLSERLKLEVSEQKTRVVNVKRRYSDFLGFKMKVHLKGQRYVVKSHVCDKAVKKQKQKLIEQAKRIANPKYGKTERDEIMLYNSMVMGLQNYYRIATHISLDFSKLQYAVRLVLNNRLRKNRTCKLRRTGRQLTKNEKERYGESKLIRFVAGTGEPIYPIGCIQHKKPIAMAFNSCIYTVEGRQKLHDNLRISIGLLLKIMRQPVYGNSVEYADNRISLFSAQWGKCAITARKFEDVDDIHCHHKIPKSAGGTDKYGNLMLVLMPVHKLINATESNTICKYLSLLRLTDRQIRLVNKYREMAGLKPITAPHT